ncbi:MAG: endonuclease III [Candidatus Latescibacteria bacterium]|nr:endonuclease III [Candidatus Latescibacterota bacterium]NIM66431.1 endonuclease III [Candidatus Latescibacterota bacterium]NIO02911.1 endonuclease III [Candidatus Latescibacterota bacterium]NIO30046.1 endonuclease III [Candidatus Latescibacterota bacterium]NIO57661.1 endonuclease III [Candidatus Latescibacterota bacterium]
MNDPWAIKRRQVVKTKLQQGQAHPANSRFALRVIEDIGKALGGEKLPSVSRLARKKRDPFKTLISTMLSLRTKDDVTSEASKKLFAVASSPEELSRTPVRVIEKAIYPIGFYKTKARSIKEISRRLIKEYDGVVPDTIEELLRFKGVGRKTANLVVTLGYGKPGICVDTHVHRVSNRLGIVGTSSPEKTEFALMEVLPKEYWIGYNELLVSFGQQICKPISPHCSKCPLESGCPKVGVGKRR